MSPTTKREPLPVAGRVPPHDLVAEQAVLSALLEDHDRADELVTFLDPSDFYAPAHATIFEAVKALRAIGKPCDVVTVRGWLHDRERLHGVGGDAYLAEIVGTAPTYSAKATYAETVRSKRLLRRMIAEAQTIAAEGYGDVGEPSEWLMSSVARVEALVSTSRTEVDRPEHIKDAIVRFYADASAREQGHAPRTYETGLPDLDALLGPVGPGDVVVLGARSHIGKSSVARQLAVQMAINGNGALVWSGEQNRERCAQAIVTQRAGISSYAKRLTSDDWTRITNAAGEVSAVPLEIYDKAGASPAEIRAAVRMARKSMRERGADLRVLIVDYVQLVSPRDLPNLERGANRERQVSEISKYIKNELAMGEGLAVFVCAQLLNKGEKARGNARPTNADLRESGSLEQDADKVVLIHNPHAAARAETFRDSGTREEPPDNETAELIVTKARGGELGTVRTTFWPRSGRFDPFSGR
jgi:replicative DNA helicase